MQISVYSFKNKAPNLYFSLNLQSWLFSTLLRRLCDTVFKSAHWFVWHDHHGRPGVSESKSGEHHYESGKVDFSRWQWDTKCDSISFPDLHNKCKTATVDTLAIVVLSFLSTKWKGKNYFHPLRLGFELLQSNGAKLLIGFDFPTSSES